MGTIVEKLIPRDLTSYKIIQLFENNCFIIWFSLEYFFRSFWLNHYSIFYQTTSFRYLSLKTEITKTFQFWRFLYLSLLALYLTNLWKVLIFFFLFSAHIYSMEGKSPTINDKVRGFFTADLPIDNVQLDFWL